MNDDKRARLKRWLESGEAQLHPLTFPQRELWETNPVSPAQPANHICSLIYLRGHLDEQICRMAVQRVVQRQEVLRLSILPGKGQQWQLVRSSMEARLNFHHLSGAQAHPQAIEELSQAAFEEPFDLIGGPLYRADIYRRDTDSYVLVLAIHHAIADGWSLGVFVQDLCAAYAQELFKMPGPLPPVTMSHSAWSAAERSYWQPRELEQRATFWRKELASPTRLWASPARSPETGSLERWVSHLPAEFTRKVRDFARAQGATLFSTLLAAFQRALSEWTGVDDILVGTPAANRHQPGVRETMGYFAGVVPMRGCVDRGRPFAEAVRTVQERSAESFANAMPFVELVQALGAQAAAGENILFQVRFALQNHPVPPVELPSLSARLEMRSTGTARFDLGCEVTETGELLEVAWLFRPELFSMADMQDLKRLFQAVLAPIETTGTSRPQALILS